MSHAKKTVKGAYCKIFQVYSSQARDPALNWIMSLDLIAGSNQSFE